MFSIELILHIPHNKRSFSHTSVQGRNQKSRKRKGKEMSKEGGGERRKRKEGKAGEGGVSEKKRKKKKGGGSKKER